VTLAIRRAAEDIGRGGIESEVCECSTRGVSVLKGGFFPNELKIAGDAANGERDIRVVNPHERFDIGRFAVEAIPVDHSVPGACAFVVTSPSGKVVFYTGDLRFHGRLGDLTSGLRERTRGLRPDVFITEGTRIVDKEGKITAAGDDETDVARKITGIVRDCAGLAIVDFGWKDTTRFQTILEVGRATGRVLAVSPKVAYLWALLNRIDPAAYPDLPSAGNVRVYLERSNSMTYSLGDYSKSKHTAGVCTDWEGMKDAYKNGDEGYLQPRLCHYRDGVRAYEIAADPSRFILHAGFFDMNELFDIAPPPGSVYISAVTEPFSHEMEIDQDKLKRWLDHFGIDYGGEEIEHHHVSGHASGRDLLDFIKSAEPKLVIPVHTERPEAFARELRTECRPPVMGEPIPVA
jgi:ribonuclease J